MYLKSTCPRFCLAHLAGNGLAVCIDRATGYGDFFAEDEFAFYSTEAELAEIVARLTRDHAARATLAERGWRRYHELCGCEVVAEYMLDALYDQATTSPWPGAA